MNNAAHIPVIVGIGEICDRPTRLENAREPVALMADALKNAEADSGAPLLADAQSIELIGLVSWRYANPVKLLCEKLGISPVRQINASMGGETPVRLIHEAALRILSGETSTSLIVGGEAMNAVSKAMKTKTPLPWTPMVSRDEAVRFGNDRIERSPIAKKLGINDPAAMYPLYEVAMQAERGISPAEGNEESAELWARYAAVAANNPHAWIRTKPSAKDIATPSDHNRMVNWPYTKLMMANPTVNQSAALIVTSLQKARELGVAEQKVIYIWGGGNAAESDDFLQRSGYSNSAAQEAVLDTAINLVGGSAKAFTKLELYSCFPVVPKMALAHLGLNSSDISPTVAGGLTFFGGPLNNYMSHACCAMVSALRAAPGELGLLYGQGGFVNKHHSLVLSTKPPAAALTASFSVQDSADLNRTAPPLLAPDDYQGPATIETYTVLHDKAGQPERGVLIVRTDDQRRGMAMVTPEDRVSMALLLDLKSNAVGLKGQVTLNTDELPVWQYSASASA